MASEETFVYTACPGWGDHDYCVLKTVTKDGAIDHTEKVVYSGVEACEGHICQKGILACRQPYDKTRLMHPLKRVGERGEGKWEKISWNQALDEIAEKLAEIRDKYGPESVALWSLPAGAPPAFGMLQLMGQRFTAAYGATDPVHRQGLDNGAQYSLDLDLGGDMTYFQWDTRIMEEADVVIVWGANPIENQMRVSMSIVEAKSRGAKIIDVGLVYDGTAGYADWFIPVKPGSDAALALAAAHVIVKEGLYDRDYLINHTVAPFLVRRDDGKFARDDDGNYLVWDTSANDTQSVPTKTFDLPADDIALEKACTVNGIECVTAFCMLEDHLEAYTPECQEQVTGVPAADCIQLGRDIGTAKATFFAIAYGLRYRNQGQIHRAVTLLAALTGTLGKPGGGCGYSLTPSSWPVVFNSLEVIAPRGIGDDNYIVGPHYTDHLHFFQDAKAGKYKAFIKNEGNPVHQNANRGKWIDDTFPNMELIVDYDVWMTDTGEYADYVLPDCMPFERIDIINSATYGHVVLQEPAIEPVGDCRPPVYFYSELAKRLGLGEYFTLDEYGYIDILLNLPYPFPPLDALDPPLTVERLKKEKMVRLAYPEDKVYNPFEGAQFPTPSGRIEFYNEEYVAADAAMAEYRPSFKFPVQEGSEYPYQFFTGRQRFFMQSMFTEDPITRELSGGKPLARMNPADAIKEGFETGDNIEVYNERGHVRVELRLDEAIPPGMVHVWFGWRANDYSEGTYAELTTPCGGEDATDELAEYWWNKTGGQGMNVFLLGSADILEGTWDTLWDATCAVRKA